MALSNQIYGDVVVIGIVGDKKEKCRDLYFQQNEEKYFVEINDNHVEVVSNDLSFFIKRVAFVDGLKLSDSNYSLRTYIPTQNVKYIEVYEEIKE